MKLHDQHVHTIYSADSMASLEEYYQLAQQLGCKYFVTTEHVDLDIAGKGVDWLADFSSLKKHLDNISLPNGPIPLLGIELGYRNDLIPRFQKIFEEKTGSKIGSQYLVASKMVDLFVNLSRKLHHRKTYDIHRYADSLKLRFEEIRLNMYQVPDDIKVSSLAKLMGFSLSRFNELYKMYFDTTPIADLTKARISRVDDLIKEGHSTKEIIKKIGFSSEEYFYRWFKKNFKMTKDEYVKSLRKKGVK